MPTYTWDSISKRYKVDGKFVPELEVRKMLGIAIDNKSVTQLTRDYKQGLISKETWHQGFRGLIKDRYIQSGVLAVGGREQMDARRWGKVGGHISEQYYHLDRKPNNFLSQIDDLTEAQAIARARMYIESSRQVFEELNRENKIDLGAVYERWVLGPKEHCEGCIDLARMGRIPIGTLHTVPGAGDTPCLTNCGCRIAYYNNKGRTLSAKEVVVILMSQHVDFEFDGENVRILGSSKSGFYGHVGRSGRRGGSAPARIMGVWEKEEAIVEAVKHDTDMWEGARSNIVGIGLHYSEDDDKIITLEDRGELVGVAILSTKVMDEVDLGYTQIDVPEGEYLYLSTLATKRVGYGRQMMDEIREQAKDHNLAWMSSNTAIGFYKHMGATQGGNDHSFYIPQAELGEYYQTDSSKKVYQN